MNSKNDKRLGNAVQQSDNIKHGLILALPRPIESYRNPRSISQNYYILTQLGTFRCLLSLVGLQMMMPPHTLHFIIGRHSTLGHVYPDRAERDERDVPRDRTAQGLPNVRCSGVIGGNCTAESCGIGCCTDAPSARKGRGER